MSTKAKDVFMWLLKETVRGIIIGLAVFLAVRFGGLR